MSDIVCKLLVYGPYGDDAQLGEVRGLSSVQWLESYQAVGETKIFCGVSDNNRSLLIKGNRIINSERPQLIAVISQIVIDDNSKTAKMTVRAKMSAALWDTRVLMHTVDIKNAEADALRLANENQRGLPCGVGAAKGYTAMLNTQKSWGSVLDALKEICEISGLGFYNKVANGLTETLELYEGIDRTDAAGEAYVGYFGDDAGNLREVRITDSDEKHRNIAIVAGRGEGAARVVVEVDLSDGAEGAARRELFVDAKDVPEKYQAEQPDGSKQDIAYTDTEYRALLEARGMEKLLERGLTLDVSAKTQESMMRAGRDYDVGDILPLQIKKYGVNLRVRVQELLFIYEDARSVRATLKQI